MRTKRISTGLLAAALMLIVGACQKSVINHKLVATGGGHSVPLYPDKATYMRVSHNAQQGGVTGMVGNAQKSVEAKQIDDQTPVKILSSDDDGAQVQIADGPLKGQAGFVARQNVD
jgi:hypothetical protein